MAVHLYLRLWTTVIHNFMHRLWTKLYFCFRDVNYYYAWCLYQELLSLCQLTSRKVSY